MQNRLLSICLILCMLFSASVISGYAEDSTDASDKPNLEFAKAMGFIGQDKNGSDTFSRGDLAKLVSSILLGNNISLTDNGKNIFSDVSYDYAPYVMAAVSSGIMNGYSESVFAPYDEVTYIQLIKTMVSILGRKEQAEAFGGYPGGYYRVASQLGLNKVAPPDMNYKVTVDGVSNVLKLMLQCDVAYIDINGRLVQTGKHYLRYYRNVDYVTGIADRFASSDTTGSFGIDCAIVDGVYYRLESGTVDTADLMGYLVDAYYHTGSSDKKVFYIEKHEANVAVVEPEQIEEITANRITYYNGTKSIDLNLDKELTVIYNNEVVGNYNEETFNPFFDKGMDGNLTLIDSDMDSRYETVKIKAYNTYVISYIDNGIIYNKYHGDVLIDTKNLDSSVIVNVFMQPLEAEKLVSGDVISVMRNLNGEITNIIVTVEYYVGTITALNSDNSSITEIEIDGANYKLSPGYTLSGTSVNLKPGMEVKVYFNPEGRICEIDTDKSLIFKIGYLIDNAKLGTMDKVECFKLLEKDGKISEFELRDKVEVEIGSLQKGIVSSQNAVAYAGTSGGRIKRQPILYTTDSSGKISRIRYADEFASKTEDGLYKYEEIANTSEYYLRGNSFGGHLLMGGSTVMFSVPSEDERDNYDLYTIMTPSAVSNGTQFEPFAAYGTKAYNPLAEIMVFERKRSEVLSPSKYSDIFVIKSITNGLNHNGDEVARVTGYIAGSEQTCDIASDLTYGLKPGDIIQLGGSIDSVISSINRVFYCDTRQMGENSEGVKFENPTSTILYTDNRFVYGDVYYSDKSAFTLMVNGQLELSYLVASFKIVLVDTSGREVTVRPGSASAIMSELDYPSNGSKVFVHTSAITPKTIVIYK